ncbi:MAG: O-antigen ligase family protein [Candidatus Moranbacteria bacterium]|nr:O-antigen ligase family protein [Candidatus Moranbacteria bacterium]
MVYKLLLLFCLYLPFQIALNPSEGIDLASVRVIIPILALLWIISGLKNRRIFIPAKIQTVLIIFFLFIAGLSLFWADNQDWGFRKLLFLLSIFPVYFVVTSIIQCHSRESGNPEINGVDSGSGAGMTYLNVKIIKFLVWGAGVTSVIGIIQFLLQFMIGLDNTAAIWRNYVTPLFLGKSFTHAVLEYPSWLVNVSGKDFLRAFSTFPDPHMLSFYLGLSLPLAIGLYYAFKKNIYLFFSLIILIANLLTFSRGGYIGLAAGLIFIVLYFAVNKKISAKKLLASLVLTLIVLASLALTPIGKRAITSFSTVEGSNKVRFENWNQAVKVIKNNPLGVGIGNYSYEIEPSAPYRKPIYAHNLYLDIAAETGIINAIIFILLVVFSIKDFVKKSKDNILYLGSAAGLVIFSIHSVFDTALYSVQVLPLLLVIIALSASNNSGNTILRPRHSVTG